MEKKIELTELYTFKNVCTELEKGRFLGSEISKEELEVSKYPFQFIFLELLDLKYDLVNRSSANKLKQLKQRELVLETLLKDAIKSLSIEELKAISFDEVQAANKTPLLTMLGKCGAEELFYIVFDKLKSDLDTVELYSLIQSIVESYKGKNLSEELNLASSLLQRGNLCFVRMFNFLIEFVMKQNKLSEVLNHGGGQTTLKIKLNSLQQECYESDLPQYTLKDYIERRPLHNNNISNEKAKEEYKIYLTDMKGKNLIQNSLCNYIRVQLIIDELIDRVSSPLFSLSDKQWVGKNYIEVAARLNPQAKAILKSMLDYKINQSQELDFLKGQDLPISTDDEEVEIGQLTIQQKLVGNFFNSYDTKLKEDQAAWCGLYGLFARSKVNKSMSLQELVRHAQSYSNRSQEVMKELKWLDEDNQLSEEIQQFVN